MPHSPLPTGLTDLDRTIWEEELEQFVPGKIFDVHTHIYRWDFNSDPEKERSAYAEIFGRQFPEASWSALEACDRLLMPGREVHRLAFPFPFAPHIDTCAANRYVAGEVASDPRSAALMLVHPSMDDEEVESALDRNGFVGLKPYYLYTGGAEPNLARLTDYLPERFIEIAARRRLLLMVHLSKPSAVGDAENCAEIVRLSEKYPNARWILGHCGRSYSAWAIEQAARHVRDLHNVWYDTSSVCETDAFDALYSTVGIERVMYGSDDLPVGVLRGKYITFGRSWTFLSETNHSLGLSHCDGRMTFVRYEQLRAMRRASHRLAHTTAQIHALFFGTADHLMQSARIASE